MAFIKIRLIFLLVLYSFLSPVFSQEERDKIADFLPPNTELVEKKISGPQQKPSLVIYKFKTSSSKDTILKFYKIFFANEGFAEYDNYSIALDNSSKKMEYCYIFNKPGYFLIFTITPLESEDDNFLEEDSFYYYITIHLLS